MSGGNVDIDAMMARWSYDDIWRIFWMTVIFGALMPLSRSTWAMTKNFSLAMALHTVTNRVYVVVVGKRGRHVVGQIFGGGGKAAEAPDLTISIYHPTKLTIEKHVRDWYVKIMSNDGNLGS